MVDAGQIRDAQRETWAGLSSGWEKWDQVIMDQLGPVSTAIVESLDAVEDQQQTICRLTTLFSTVFRCALGTCSSLTRPTRRRSLPVMTEHVSLAVAALKQVDESARERIPTTVIADVSAYEHGDKVRVPGVARCIVGKK